MPPQEEVEEEPPAEPEKLEPVPSDNVPPIVQLDEPAAEPEQPEFVPSDYAAQETEPPVEPEKPEFAPSDDVAQPDEPLAEPEEPVTPIQDVPSADVMAQTEEEPSVKTPQEPAQDFDLLTGYQPPPPEDTSAPSFEEAPQFEGEQLVAEEREDEDEPQETAEDKSAEPATDLPAEEGEEEGEREEEAQTVSKDDEEWVMVDETVPPTEDLLGEMREEEVPEPTPQLPGEEEEEEEEEKGEEPSYPSEEQEEQTQQEEEEARDETPQPPPEEEEEQHEEPSYPREEPQPPQQEDEEESAEKEEESQEQEQQPALGGGEGGQEPLSPYYEVPVPSSKPGVQVADLIGDQDIPSDDTPALIGDQDVPSDDTPAQPDSDLIGDQDVPSDDTPAQPDSDLIGDQDIPSDDTPAQLDDKEESMLQQHDLPGDNEAGEPESREEEDEEQMGSSFIPISVQEVDARSETSSTAAVPSTPPLSMVVERGSPVPELTEPSVTSQDDEQEDLAARDQAMEGVDMPTYEEEGEQEEEEEEEAVDDVEEEVAQEVVDGEREEMGEETGPAFGGDVVEEEEVVDDVQEELVATGEEMTRTAEGTEDDGAAGEEAEDAGEEGEGEEGEEGEREDGDEGEGGEGYEGGEGEVVGGGEEEEPPPEEDDDGSLQTPIQFEPDPPARQGVVDNLLDFDPQGGASAGPPPPSDPFGMDPLELVTTPPHKAANEIFGQDPFGASAAAPSDQSYNPFAPVSELDPFSMGGDQGFGGGAAGDSLLMDDPVLIPEGQGGLRPDPDEAAELRDSGVQSPDILPPEQEGGVGGISREPDFGAQGVAGEGGFGFESSADPPPPPDDDLLGTPVD